MGDKPGPTKNIHLCTNMLWAGGLQPDIITFSVFDTSRGDAWAPPMPVTIDGTYVLGWVSCNNWSGSGPYGAMSLIAVGTNLVIDSILGGMFGAFTYNGPAYDWLFVANGNQNSAMAFWGGFLTGNLFFNGGPPPASWDGASLIGVPAADNYFAEEFAATGYDRFLRYANKTNKTNVKMVGNF